ncbi:FHA domain-containing protein [Nocardia sp. IFM 10818]
MGRIPTTVGLARGDGLVARFGNVVIFLAGESPSTERVLGAAETASSAGDPGVAIAQRLAATVFTSGSAHPPAFGVVAPTSGGILILLRGPVRAIVDGPEGTRHLSGVRAMTWADEILRDPVRRLTIAADARTTSEIPHTDLRAGVAAAGGFILHAPPTGVTPHSRTTSSALPKPTPPPTDPAVSTPDQTRRAPLPTPSHTRFAAGETPARHTPPTSAAPESPPEPPVTRPQTRAPEPLAPQPKTAPSTAPAARPQTTAEPPSARPKTPPAGWSAAPPEPPAAGPASGRPVTPAAGWPATGPETIAAGPGASAHSKPSTAAPAASRRATSPEPAETQATTAADAKALESTTAQPFAHRDPSSGDRPIAGSAAGGRGGEPAARSRTGAAGSAKAPSAASPEPAETQAMTAADQKNYGSPAASPSVHRDPPSGGHPIAGSAAGHKAASSSEQAAARGAAAVARGGESAARSGTGAAVEAGRRASSDVPVETQAMTAADAQALEAGAASPPARRIPWSAGDPVASPAGSSSAEPDVTRVAATEDPADQHKAVRPQDPQAEVPTVTRGPGQQPPTAPAPKSDPQAVVPTIDRATGAPKDRAAPVLSDPPPYPALGNRSGKPPREATTETRMPGPVPSWPGEHALQRRNSPAARDSEPGSPHRDIGRGPDPVSTRATEPAAGRPRGGVLGEGWGEPHPAGGSGPGSGMSAGHGAAEAGSARGDIGRAQDSQGSRANAPAAGGHGGKVSGGGRGESEAAGSPEAGPRSSMSADSGASEPSSARGEVGPARDPLDMGATEPAAGRPRGNVSSGVLGKSEAAGAPEARPQGGAHAGGGLSDSDAARAQATTRMDNAEPAVPGADAPHSFGWRPKFSKSNAGEGKPGGREGRPDPESQPPTAEFDAEAAAFEDVASGQQAADGRPGAAQTVMPGALTTSDGSVYPLDRPYVVGRDPMIDEGVRRAQAAPIVIPRNRHVSRVHAYVYVEGGVVFVRDAATPGGTFVAAPGAADWIRVGQRPIELKPGWSVRIGQRILTYRADPGRRYLDG